MERLLAFVLIHYDARGTRVLLRHPLPGRSDPALHVAGGADLITRPAPRGVGSAGNPVLDLVPVALRAVGSALAG